jgi:hypothetical protein
MPRMDLTELIVALLHHVAGPRHRRLSRCGGRRHRRPAPAPSQPTATSATPNPRVLERLSSPSHDRLAYQPMEPSDHDASPRGRRCRSCVIHGWGSCPNPVALAVESSSRGQDGEAKGEEEEEPRWTPTVTGLVQGQLTRRTARKTVGPRDRPQGQITPRTTTPSALLTPSLAAPPASAPPPNKADLLGSGTSSDLKSLCGNRVIRWLARFATQTGKGRAPGSWDSTAGPSR